MRQLHPVSFHEKFVASGTYTLYQGNLPTGDVEHWSMHEPGEGSLTIRSDRDGRGGTGANWILEALCVRESLERFDLEVFGENTTAAQFFLEQYGAIISKRINGETRSREEIALPAGYVASPPSLVAQFLFVSASVGWRVPVLVTELDFQGGLVAGQHVHEWTVEDAGEAEHAIGEERIPVREYRIRNGDEMTCWFDKHNVLMRCENAAGARALLTQYVRRPEPQL